MHLETAKKDADRQFQSMKMVLLTTPEAGRAIGSKNYRIYAIPRTPFSVIYRVVIDRVEIMYIHDQRSGTTPNVT